MYIALERKLMITCSVASRKVSSLQTINKSLIIHTAMAGGRVRE